jgi:hypothetical protein
MLDEERQLRNFQAKLANGRVVPDEGAAAETIVIALKAVAEWLQHRGAANLGADSPNMHKLADSVEKLTHSNNNVIRARARETLLALSKKWPRRDD